MSSTMKRLAPVVAPALAVAFVLLLALPALAETPAPAADDLAVLLAEPTQTPAQGCTAEAAAGEAEVLVPEPLNLAAESVPGPCSGLYCYGYPYRQINDCCVPLKQPQPCQIVCW